MPRRRRPTFSNNAQSGTTDYGTLPSVGSPGSSKTHSSSELLDHRDRDSRKSTSNSQTKFVDRWIRRSSVSTPARQHLLDPSANDSVGIPIEDDDESELYNSDVPSLKSTTSAVRAALDSNIDDVCMPLKSPREEVSVRRDGGQPVWPDISVLNDFSIKEMKNSDDREAETDNDGVGSRYAVNEAEQGGPLRPPRLVPWAQAGKRKNGNKAFEQYRDQRSAGPQFRFTYFRDDLPATIHSPSISGLLQPGQSFEDLFPPGTADAAGTIVGGVVPTKAAPPEGSGHHQGNSSTTPVGSPRFPPDQNNADDSKRSTTPSEAQQEPFWLDIMDPTEEEMRVIAKAFDIHPLTTEDIILRENREKVEVFHSYYFICFSSFQVSKKYSKRRGLHSRRMSTSEHSVNSSVSRRRRRSEKLKPLPVYTVVFPGGVITVHYGPTPHTINVRRRIRLLREYLNVSSDWISYALIDDITDGFAPLIHAIEDEVTRIEDAILVMHGVSSDTEGSDSSISTSPSQASTITVSTLAPTGAQKGEMLRQIGESRKRATALLGLLGNKADVIKGFSKRVTDRWSSETRNEIGMYLSDIQDHLVTMVQSLNHYEKLLGRAHSNYLAQLSIDMNTANSAMNDVLNKLSVLGTIVLPMNIVTGLMGMNVWVPGQSDKGNLLWFWSLTGSMLLFGLLAWYMLRRYV